MLSNFIEKIKSVVTPNNEQYRLDAFITSQHPTSVAEVEHWTKVYDQRQHDQRSNNFFNYSL